MARNTNPISTFVINLKQRTDRKANVLKEFSGRDEFKVTVVEPKQHVISRISLWNTIKYIVQYLTTPEDEFIIICEDDHQFTNNYRKEFLFKCIEQANNRNSDILSGGVSALDHFARVSKEIIWMGNFSGLQFTVIYKRFFETLLTALFSDTDAADMKISQLTENKYFIYPFVSIQKEFGYSDVTPLNNNKGRVDALFDRASNSVKFVDEVTTFYKQQQNELLPIDESAYENFFIPTYIINLPERTDRLANIKEQFECRDEFDLNIIKAISHEKGNLGLWLTIRKIIEDALSNKDDIIVICEDDHMFTDAYSKSNFLKNVVEAHALGAGILLGGIANFRNCALIMDDKFWIDNFSCVQFMVIYRSLFEEILQEAFDDRVNKDHIFSKITSNKMVTFPFISIQNDFKYVEPGISCKREDIKEPVDNAQKRFENIKKISNIPIKQC